MCTRSMDHHWVRSTSWFLTPCVSLPSHMIPGVITLTGLKHNYTFIIYRVHIIVDLYTLPALVVTSLSA